MNQSEFVEELKKINISINEYQLKQLEKYYELLIDWNEKINLTAIIDKESVYLKHFYDSLTMNIAIDLSKAETLCDIGSGAGFPGLVLKILFPNLKVALVDSLNKRINFLNQVIKELDLKNIETIHERAEEFTKLNREKYDVVTARAVANLNTLFELCISSVKVNGYFIPMKGNITEEIISIENELKLFNCTIISQESFLLPKENSNRTILVIKKNSKTDKKYPRKFNEIKGKPL